MLLDHVRRLVHGAGKHELPMEARGLGLHATHWHGQIGVVDTDNATLRPDQLNRRVPVPHVVEDRDMIDVLDANGLHLRNHVLAVVDDMIRAKRFHPIRSFGTGCGGDHC